MNIANMSLKIIEINDKIKKMKTEHQNSEEKFHKKILNLVEE